MYTFTKEQLAALLRSSSKIQAERVQFGDNPIHAREQAIDTTIACLDAEAELYAEGTIKTLTDQSADVTPDLLDALRAFVAQYEGDGYDERERRPEMVLARHAIAKANA